MFSRQKIDRNQKNASYLNSFGKLHFGMIFAKFGGEI